MEISKKQRERCLLFFPMAELEITKKIFFTTFMHDPAQVANT